MNSNRIKDLGLISIDDFENKYINSEKEKEENEYVYYRL